jgi:hypothetical protein
MKRYNSDDLPVVKKHSCEVCGRKARMGTKSLVSDGWLKTKDGLICPSCPEHE